MSKAGTRLYSQDDLPIEPINPLPVTNIPGGHSLPTSLKVYNLTINTIGSFIPLTLTNQVVGITINARSNTTASDAPSFDIAHTSTGTPFMRLPENSAYFEESINLPTNTVLYFRALSQTNAVIQVMTKE